MSTEEQPTMKQEEEKPQTLLSSPSTPDGTSSNSAVMEPKEEERDESVEMQLDSPQETATPEEAPQTPIASTSSSSPSSSSEQQWGTPSKIAGVVALVKNREEVFRKHRLLDIAARQTASHQLIEDFQKATKSVSVRSAAFNTNYFDLYSTFCRSTSIPIFPITSRIVTLYVAHRGMKAYKELSRMLGALNRLRVATESAWTSVQGAEEAILSLRGDTTLENLIAEMGGVELSSKATSAGPVRYIGVVPPTPGLPQVGDKFASPDQLLQACRNAVLPVFGLNVYSDSENSQSMSIKCARTTSYYRDRKYGRCEFVLKAALDKQGYWVVDVRSLLSHNHPPCDRILKDPSYRPPITTRRRRRLSLSAEAEGPEDEQDSGSEDENGSRKGRAKRARRSNTKLSSTYREQSLTDSEYEDGQVTTYNSPSRGSSCFSVRSTGRSRPQTFASSPPSIPPSPRSRFEAVPAASPAPHAIKPASLSPYTPNTYFLPSLTSFLSALSPSFTSLAPTLLAQGLDSTDHLLSFIVMSSEGRNKLLEIVKASWLQKTLLEAKMRVVLGAMKGGGMT